MPHEIEALIDTYPRVRPPLSDAWQAAYHKVYLQSRDGKTWLYGITQKLEAWMHKRVAANAAPGGRVLELGAGTLNHLRWEPEASVYDVVEPYAALYEGRPATSRVRAFYADIADVPRENVYDRIVSIATLEHVLDLPRLLAEAALRMSPGGSFIAGIPSEGGMLWGLSWRMSVGLACKLRTGLNYGDLMRHEHVNQAKEIRSLCSHFFDACRVRRFPTPAHHLSLYACLYCERPRLDRCRAFLERDKH